MKWFIDGYNVTRSDPATKDLSLEEQRRALEARLRVRAQRVLGGSDYVIVWDGADGFARGGVPAGSTAAASAKQEFTRMNTADDSIVGRVRRARERVGIVTSDNGLANRCEGAAEFGVEIRSASCLFKEARQKKTKGTPARRDVGIPSNANDITRWYKDQLGLD